MATLDISLPDTMRSFVEKETERGGFSSVSEYVCALIRDAQDRRAQAEMETRLLEGVTSPNGAWTAERRTKLRRRVAGALDGCH